MREVNAHPPMMPSVSTGIAFAMILIPPKLSTLWGDALDWPPLERVVYIGISFAVSRMPLSSAMRASA